jgi:hypothetical protein
MVSLFEFAAGVESVLSDFVAGTWRKCHFVVSTLGVGGEPIERQLRFTCPGAGRGTCTGCTEGVRLSAVDGWCLQSGVPAAGDCGS